MTECEVTYRGFLREDLNTCLALFDANCPAFFAPNERRDYRAFLEACPDEYQVCSSAGRVVGAFGVFTRSEDSAALNWILLDPGSHGRGIGSQIMRQVSAQARQLGVRTLHIAASHRSAAFFARFGAVAHVTTQHGWGPGMHRVDMTMSL